MAARDPRIDDYIGRSAPFAQPILRHLRDCVHSACPDLRETIKWSAPFFDYHGPLCHMAAFKQHCAFGFWKAKLVFEDVDSAPATTGTAMGQLGRITDLSDLPGEAVLRAWLHKAMRINEAGTPSPSRSRSRAPRALPDLPDDLAEALRNKPAAQACYEGFSPSNKREYLEWIIEAKRPETRAKRLETAVQWMAEGKTRNWKYVKC